MSGQEEASTSGQLELWERAVAAASASVISSLVVNPLDVVKASTTPDLLTREFVDLLQTRMQAQATAAKATQPMYHLLSQCTGWSRYAHQGAALALPQPPPYRSAFDGLATILRSEGARALWRGTDIALVLSVPLVAIYFPLYDMCNSSLQRHVGGSPLSPYTPLLAGSAARAAACFAVSPLELIKTRMQAGGASNAGQFSKVWADLRREAASRRLSMPRVLWTGFGATLVKDIPFAATYWAVLEPLRAALFPLLDLRSVSEGWHAGFRNLLDRPLPLPLADADGGPSLGASGFEGRGASSGEPLGIAALGSGSLAEFGAHGRSGTSGGQGGGGLSGLKIPHAGDSTVPEQISEGGPMSSSVNEALLPPPLVPEQRQRHSPAEILAVNAVAGTIAGGVAATVTQPFDLLKTRMMTAGTGPRKGSLQVFSELVRKGGPKALFVGGGARTARTAVGYAILMSSYEIWKAVLTKDIEAA